MLYAIMLTVHIIVCLLLIVIVLLQSGRGGGLSESFSGAESLFGTKTNVFLTRATTFFAVIFFITCLFLVFLSKQRSRSLFSGRVIPAANQPKSEPAQVPLVDETKQAVPLTGDAVPAQNTPAAQQPVETRAK